MIGNHPANRRDTVALFRSCTIDWGARDRIKAATWTAAVPAACGRDGRSPEFSRRSLNNLVGAGEKRLRHSEAKGLGGLQINYELEFGWLLDGKVARRAAFEDLVYLD
jgi:hypothetical protein